MEDSRRSFQVPWAERLAAAGLWAVALAVVGALSWIVIDIAWRGAAQLSLSFLFEPPRDAGRQGGIGPMIGSTLLLLLVTMGVAIPIALSTAVALAEFSRQGHWAARLVRRSLDGLAAVPSIVFGLFGNAFFGITLGLGYSILTGGLTLACMVLPIMIRVTEQALRSVPQPIRQGAIALGLSRTTTLLKVELPAAAPALGVGLVLGVGRALAETAALLFTAGYVTRPPESLLDSGRALSVHIFDLAMNVPGGGPQAYATAMVLVGLLVVVNAIVFVLTRLAGTTESIDGSWRSRW